MYFNQQLISVLNIFIIGYLINSYNGFNLTSGNNLVAYWGQNSYGNSETAPKEYMEKPINDYCNDETYDMLVLSFLTKFNAESQHSHPVLNLGKHCTRKFTNSLHPYCPEVAAGIKYCQKKGKKILLSMGGYAGDYTIKNDEDAGNLAKKLWDLYLGGKAEHRPFGDVVLDGIDLDIEKGPPESYATFSNKLKEIFDKESKDRKYYISAAPQCPFPDKHLKKVLEHGWVDMVFVQFYNNDCAVGKENFNFDAWDGWARFASKNKEAKIFLGAPGGPTAASSGYLNFVELEPIIKEAKEKFPAFGGVMLWDVSQADMNSCKEVNKIYSVAISQLLKGEHEVDQPGNDRFFSKKDESEKSEPNGKPKDKDQEKEKVLNKEKNGSGKDLPSIRMPDIGQMNQAELPSESIDDSEGISEDKPKIENPEEEIRKEKEKENENEKNNQDKEKQNEHPTENSIDPNKPVKPKDENSEKKPDENNSVKSNVEGDKGESKLPASDRSLPLMPEAEDDKTKSKVFEFPKNSTVEGISDPKISSKEKAPKVKPITLGKNSTDSTIDKNSEQQTTNSGKDVIKPTSIEEKNQGSNPTPESKGDERNKEKEKAKTEINQNNMPTKVENPNTNQIKGASTFSSDNKKDQSTPSSNDEKSKPTPSQTSNSNSPSKADNPTTFKADNGSSTSIEQASQSNINPNGNSANSSTGPLSTSPSTKGSESPSPTQNNFNSAGGSPTSSLSSIDNKSAEKQISSTSNNPKDATNPSPTPSKTENTNSTSTPDPQSSSNNSKGDQNPSLIPASSPSPSSNNTKGNATSSPSKADNAHSDSTSNPLPTPNSKPEDKSNNPPNNPISVPPSPSPSPTSSK